MFYMETTAVNQIHSNLMFFEKWSVGNTGKRTTLLPGKITE